MFLNRVNAELETGITSLVDLSFRHLWQMLGVQFPINQTIR